MDQGFRVYRLGSRVRVLKFKVYSKSSVSNIRDVAFGVRGFNSSVSGALGASGFRNVFPSWLRV